MIPDANEIAMIVNTAIKAKSDSTPRTIQGREGRIGPSDIGFCRQKAALMTRGTAQTDSRAAWPANVGTAIHEWVEDALRGFFPGWIIEGQRVTATLPNGAEISGTPDVIVPEWNAVLDIKTVDGFENIKRFGTSQNHKFQRHLYAMGAVQADLLDGERTVYVGNIYLDRSGRNVEPYVVVEEYDPTLTDEINSWVDDVIYAAQHGEDAHRDVAAPVCERICEYFTACRGSLPVGENEVIDAPEIREAVLMYVEGRETKKVAERQMDEAKAVLSGLNGVAAGYQVRTTFIPESEVPGYTRSASERLDVRRVRA